VAENSRKCLLVPARVLGEIRDKTTAGLLERRFIHALTVIVVAACVPWGTVKHGIMGHYYCNVHDDDTVV